VFNVTLHVTIRDIGLCSPDYVTYFSHLRVQVAFVWEVRQCNSAYVMYTHLFWQPLFDTHWTYLCYMRAFPFLLASEIWKPGTEDTEFLANAPQWYAHHERNTRGESDARVTAQGFSRLETNLTFRKCISFFEVFLLSLFSSFQHSLFQKWTKFNLYVQILAKTGNLKVPSATIFLCILRWGSYITNNHE